MYAGTISPTVPLHTRARAVILAAALALAAAAPGLAEEKNWMIQGAQAGQDVKVNTQYALINRTNDRPLVYGKREYGINLTWGDAKAPRREISFALASGTTVHFGDKVAIRVEGGGYLKYEKRRWGINLTWSDVPVYEWEVQGGTAGAPVTTGKAVSLYNHVENDHMVYCKRPMPVINLAWADDCIGGIRPPQPGEIPSVPGLPQVPKLP